MLLCILTSIPNLSFLLCQYTDLVLAMSIHWPWYWYVNILTMLLLRQYTDVVLAMSIHWPCSCYVNTLTLFLLCQHTYLVLAMSIHWPCSCYVNTLMLFLICQYTDLVIAMSIHWPFSCYVNTLTFFLLCQYTYLVIAMSMHWSCSSYVKFSNSLLVLYSIGYGKTIRKQHFHLSFIKYHSLGHVEFSCLDWFCFCSVGLVFLLCQSVDLVFATSMRLTHNVEVLGLSPLVSLCKKLYPYCLVLVGSRNWLEHDFTIKLNWIEGLGRLA